MQSILSKPNSPFPPAGMVVTDLDGTLIHGTSEFSPKVLDCLAELGSRQVVRVVATGRSPFVARRLLDENFPIDFLIFSTGLGVIQWASQELLVLHQLKPTHTEKIASELVDRELSFFLHSNVPNNHFFAYHRSDSAPPDFDHRLQRYREFAHPLVSAASLKECSQFIVVCEAEGGANAFDELTEAFSEFQVVRATSPLDGKSIWVEIFPRGVSKSQSADWLMGQLNVPHSRTLAVGNDYNDIDLLDWANTSFVVENTPEILKERYDVVPSGGQDGFCVAVERWFQS